MPLPPKDTPNPEPPMSTLQYTYNLLSGALGAPITDAMSRPLHGAPYFPVYHAPGHLLAPGSAAAAPPEPARPPPRGPLLPPHAAAAGPPPGYSTRLIRYVGDATGRIEPLLDATGRTLAAVPGEAWGGRWINAEYDAAAREAARARAVAEQAENKARAAREKAERLEIQKDEVRRRREGRDKKRKEEKETKEKEESDGEEREIREEVMQRLRSGGHVVMKMGENGEYEIV